MKFGASKEFFKPGPVPGVVKLSPEVRHEANHEDLKRICETVGLEPDDHNMDMVRRILAASNYVAFTRKS